MFNIWLQGSEGSSPDVEHVLVAMEMLPQGLSKPPGSSLHQSRSGRCGDPVVWCYRCTFHLAGATDVSNLKSTDNSKRH